MTLVSLYIRFLVLSLFDTVKNTRGQASSTWAVETWEIYSSENLKLYTDRAEEQCQHQNVLKPHLTTAFFNKNKTYIIKKLKQQWIEWLWEFRKGINLKDPCYYRWVQPNNCPECLPLPQDVRSRRDTTNLILLLLKWLNKINHYPHDYHTTSKKLSASCWICPCEPIAVCESKILRV